MQSPALENVLITNVGTFFGQNLAQSFVDEGYNVYGSGNKYHPGELLLSSPNFTLLDLDLSQPIPTHIPQFEKIIHLVSENYEGEGKISTVTNRLAELSSQGTKVFLVTNIAESEKLASNIEQKLNDNLTIIGLGHVYGPYMNLHSTHQLPQKNLFFENNELINLISQAVQTERVILNNDGLDILYPTYISDAIYQIKKIIKNRSAAKSIKTVVSNQPLSALSLAYEIQNCARSILNKELNLFFVGPESLDKNPKAEIKIHNNFDNPHSLTEGLRDTFEYFRLIKRESKINVQKQATEKPLILNSAQLLKSKEPGTKNKKFKIKFPSIAIFPSKKFKNATLFFVLIILFLSVKLSVNIYLGISDIKKASQFLHSADFDEAQLSSTNATKHFSSAKKTAKILLSPFGYITPAKNLNDGFESLESASQSTLNFTEGAKLLSQNFIQITSTTNGRTDVENTSALFTKSYFGSQYALSLASNAQKIPIIGNSFKEGINSLKQLSETSLSAREMTVALPELTGTNDKKTYLVILMNNTELRPGGGFIGNFAEITFDEGKLTDIKVEDIYTIDGQLKEIITPPFPLKEKLGVTQLYLRDSNWSNDFRVNSQTIRDFYRKETGKTVDGVIALDLTLIERFLKHIGPVNLIDYNEEISSENLFERGQYHSEVGFFPGSTQKRDFFSALTNALVAKLLEGLSNSDSNFQKNSALALFQTISEGFKEKHIMMSISDGNISSLVETKGWDNPIPPNNYNPGNNSSTKDFLALSEANVGANKVNRYLKREISYDMTIGRDADLMATLTIKYKNESPADTWPGGTYVNYLRVLAPLNSSLESYLENGKEIDLEQTVRGVTSQTVETTQSGDFTQFAKIVEVPYNSTKSFTFKYRIHKNIKLETAPIYELYVSKQPGTLEDPLKFTFNLPAYLKTTKINELNHETQNYQIQTDLITDKKFVIEVRRK